MRREYLLVPILLLIAADAPTAIDKAKAHRDELIKRSMDVAWKAKLAADRQLLSELREAAGSSKNPDDFASAIADAQASFNLDVQSQKDGGDPFADPKNSKDENGRQQPLTFSDVPTKIQPDKCKGRHLFSEGVVGSVTPNDDGTVTVLVVENAKYLGGYCKEYDKPGEVGAIQVSAEIILPEADGMRYTKLDLVNIAGTVDQVVFEDSRNVREMAKVKLKLKDAKIK